MRYLKVQWLQDDPEYPTFLYSELDDDSFEVRKVDMFADGSADPADEHHETCRTFLGEGAVPPIEEIASDPEFLPEWIPREEFETVWQAAHRVPNLA